MPAAGTKPESAPVWLELTALDPEAAGAFWTGLLGVTLGEPHGGMRALNHQGGAIGLLVPAGPGDETGWLVHLLATDVDRSVRRATAAGGEVLVPVTTASSAGRYAVLRDPSGARVGLFEPWDLPGVEVEGEPGTPGGYELHATSGYEEAVRFYEEGLGWAVSSPGDSDASRTATRGRGPTPAAGIVDGSIAEAGAPSSWLVLFVVADADAAADRIRRLGGTVDSGPDDTPSGRVGLARDPEGSRFGFLTPPASAPREG